MKSTTRSKKLFFFAGWLLFTALALQAQLAISNSAGGTGGGYVVGPGDTLNIQVYGSQELSGPVQVDERGQIYLPYDPQPIQAAGKTVAQLVPLIAQALTDHQLAINPQVNVMVSAVKSRPIVVLGAVKQPVTLQAVTPQTLRACLAQASGLASDAGRYILLTVHGRNGQPATLRLPTGQVLFSPNPADNPLLHGGDEVRVTYGSQIYVAGAVNKQGAFPMSFRAHMTVLRAIAMMHGWTNTAKPGHAWLIRARQGKLQFIKLNLPKIVSRKAPDLPLLANDVLYIPNSTAKTIGYDLLTSALSIVTGAEATSLGIMLSTRKIY